MQKYNFSLFLSDRLEVKFFLFLLPKKNAFHIHYYENGIMIKKFLNFYNKLMLKMFRIRLLNIDRNKFLKRCWGDAEKQQDLDNVRRKSRRLIALCCFTTSFLTFLCTIPTNLWVSLPLIIFDFAQFQFFVFVIQQQLLYLYGYLDLRNNAQIETPNGLFLLWLQNEIMMDDGDSLKMKLKTGIGFVARKALTFLITKSPFRIVIMSALRQLLKWCGVIATHQFIDFSIDLIVCILCALIAALVSLWQFYPMCKKLRKKLEATDINYYYQMWKDEVRM